MAMQEITTNDAPPSIGPFSRAVESDGTVYVSGQGPINPDTEEIVKRDPRVQTRRTLDNIAAILDAADRSLDDIVKATIFVSDMAHYDAINEVYGEMLSEPYPARSAVEVVRMPVDILVEIEVMAE